MTETNLPKIVPVDPELNKTLLQYYKGEKDGYVLVGDKKWCLPVKYKKYAQTYLDFKTRSDDVWVAGYPRSGTTVTQTLCWILNQGKKALEKFDENFLIQNIRFFEGDIVMNDKTIGDYLKEHPNDTERKNFFDFMQNVTKELEEQTESRTIKTHLPFELLPSNLLESGAKTVYCFRNPKDVVLSYYLLQRNLIHVDFQGEFCDYWNFFKNGNGMFTPYFEHVKQAYEKRNHPNVLFVFYEEIKQDLHAFIKKVANFLGKALSKKEVDVIAKYLDFENFQKKNDGLEGRKSAKGENDKFIRKGKGGEWKNYFNDEMNEEADKWIEKNFAEIGIKFPGL